MLPGQGRAAVRHPRRASCSAADHLRERLRFVVPFKNRADDARSPTDTPRDAEAGSTERRRGRVPRLRERIRPFVKDTSLFLQDSLAAGKRLIFEARGGACPTSIHGTYPYVTSSSSSAVGHLGRLRRSVEVREADHRRCEGVHDARGAGPFPTELDNGLDGERRRIRKIGANTATVTGAPRRVGWFDAVAVRYTALSGADRNYRDAPGRAERLARVEAARPTNWTASGERTPATRTNWSSKPVYESIPSWSEDITGARKLSDLLRRREVHRPRERTGGAEGQCGVGRPRPRADDSGVSSTTLTRRTRSHEVTEFNLQLLSTPRLCGQICLRLHDDFNSPRPASLRSNSDGRAWTRLSLPRTGRHHHGRQRPAASARARSGQKGTRGHTSVDVDYRGVLPTRDPATTLYCLSSENWKRPSRKSTSSCALLKEVPSHGAAEDPRPEHPLHGDRPSAAACRTEVLAEIDENVRSTQHNTGLTLCLAINSNT